MSEVQGTATDGWRALTHPQAVAVFGASDDPNKIGGRPIAYMKRFGYDGLIIPVNPARDTVQGLKAYPTLAAAGVRADAAVVAVGGRKAVDAVVEAAELGVRVCVVIASGFGEGGDANGSAMLDQMLTAARKNGMRIIGPNSQGVASFHSGSILSFSTLFSEAEPLDGPVGIVSQSGAMASVPYAMLRERGYGVRYVHASGNDADVTVAGLAESVLLDEAIRVLILYVENLSDADGLRQVGMLARRRGVPVLALYGGLSPGGQEAAASHTGALATDEVAVRGFFDRIGVWLASSMEEVIDSVPIWLGQHWPLGGRLAGISSSGASCVLISDAAHRCGLTMPSFSEATQATLAERMPTYASASNPTDVTAALLTDPDLLGDCVEVIAGDGAQDAIVIALPVTGVGYAVEAFARSIARTAAARDVFMVSVISNPQTRDVFLREGLLVFEDVLRAVRAIENVAFHPLFDESLGDEFERARQVSLPSTGCDEVLVDEHTAGNILEEAGIFFGKREFIDGDSLQGWHGLNDDWPGDRVVVKAVTADTSHKSEFGLVLVSSVDRGSVVAASETVMERCRGGGLNPLGVLICEFLEGDVEFLAGAKYDDRIGVVSVVGFGGKLAELDPDVTVLVEPLTSSYVRKRLGTLRGSGIFEGFRDVPPVSREALAEAVCVLGEYVAKRGGQVSDAEVNPLMCSESTVAGADAVIHTRTASVGQEG